MFSCFCFFYFKNLVHFIVYIVVICVALTLNAMLRLDRNPPSQLWGQHSAKACTAPTQSHTGPAAAAAAGARARARCSSGPGGLNTGQRSRLARTRFNSCAIARAHVSKLRQRIAQLGRVCIQ